MATKERLYRLVEELPEEDVPAAEKALEEIRDPVLRSLRDAPLDDEPDDDDFDGGLTEARAQIARGETISHAEIKREFGIA